MTKIGEVNINLDYYHGQDLYSDGDIEDELLEIVQNYSEDSYDEIILKKQSWPVLYHLTKIRENILNWYDFENDKTALEVGAGCGAITGVLTRKLKKVAAVDLSKKRSEINAYRHQKCSNLEIIIGNFQEFAEATTDQYDYVTLIGVLEYAHTYLDDPNAVDKMLQLIHQLLNTNGKIIIAIENKLGLKYFAGCKEDHTGKYFDGIEGYQSVKGIKTFSKKELSERLLKNGFSDLEYYYPYPDYKLPSRIFTDDYLPKKGELYDNIRNYDADRIILFDETLAYDSIIDAGLFPELSNSYLVIAQKSEDKDE